MLDTMLKLSEMSTIVLRQNYDTIWVYLALSIVVRLGLHILTQHSSSGPRATAECQNGVR